MGSKVTVRQVEAYEQRLSRMLRTPYPTLSWQRQDVGVEFQHFILTLAEFYKLLKPRMHPLDSTNVNLMGEVSMYFLGQLFDLIQITVPFFSTQIECIYKWFIIFT